MPTSFPDDASDVAVGLHRVQDRVSAACRTAGRDPAEVRLLVATKTRPPAAIRAVIAAGADLIGENRVQEITAKAPEIADLVGAGAVEVHLIGPLQKNKINQVLPHVSAIDTVATAELAGALASRCERAERTVDVLVQVNVSGEESKSGIAPDGAFDLAALVGRLDGLHLRGFMTIGANTDDEQTIRAGFALLRGIRDRVLASGLPGTNQARELSMGMSGDLEIAVAEGATQVRVGSAIFGPRPPA